MATPQVHTPCQPKPVYSRVVIAGRPEPTASMMPKPIAMIATMASQTPGI
jgi:hypothetical protein